jgi:hypothetical protein
MFCITILLPAHSQSYMTSIITFQYYSPYHNYTNTTEDTRTNGIVSTRSSQTIIRDRPAFVMTDAYGNFDACKKPIHANNFNNGIAIIQRGGNCTFSMKITQAKQHGASGMINRSN